ncbi:hypothetical protein POJ06DRAFT_98331 [Lipomyces tetrasporus]|uniref:Uncharacterized protein n=1 Tax=Lipomyces tetrasporus TaxID=54092 RepID=A0AAD7QUB7_9ASCO|nr:uncharacterized protein POJ06DRAFT_98331 [Lipomyces tetrasporus]KAJ8101534.1 hypothetical protein POJ06DRAFT_98331 [Lipomyces tetrasporus]
MRLRLTLLSPSSPDPFRIIYPLPPAFLSSSPTILDLVYTIHQNFPGFFHEPHELERYNNALQFPDDGQHTDELFRPVDYGCETADGWSFCLWHLVADSLRDEDHVIIRKLEDENILSLPKLACLETLTYPRPAGNLLRLNGTNSTVGRKRVRDEGDHGHELSAAVSPESDAKRRKVEVEDGGALPRPATPTVEDVTRVRSAPFEGSVATKSRNARRRRARAAQRRLEEEKLEKVRSELLGRAEKLVVVSDEPTTSERFNPVEEEERETTGDEDDHEAPERYTSKGLSIVDRIGSQIQSALSAISQVVKVATPQRKKRDVSLQAIPVKDEVEQELKAQSSTADQEKSAVEMAELDSTSRDKIIDPTNVVKRRRPVVVIAEAVDCENPSNRSLQIPPFPFQQVNLDEFWKPKYDPSQVTIGHESSCDEGNTLKANKKQTRSLGNGNNKRKWSLDHAATSNKGKTKARDFDNWRKETNVTEVAFLEDLSRID